MNGKLPLIAYRTSILSPQITSDPLTLVKAPTSGTAIEVAEKKEAQEPKIKLTLKRLATFIKLVKKRDEPIVNVLVYCIDFIIKPLNRKGVKKYSYKGTTQKKINQLRFNSRRYEYAL